MLCLHVYKCVHVFACLRDGMCVFVFSKHMIVIKEGRLTRAIKGLL